MIAYKITCPALLSDTCEMDIKTSLSVTNVPTKDVSTLKLKMADKKRVHGDEIANYTHKPCRGSGGISKVTIVYKEEKGEAKANYSVTSLNI